MQCRYISPPEAGKYTCTANNFIKQYISKLKKTGAREGFFQL